MNAIVIRIKGDEASITVPPAELTDPEQVDGWSPRLRALVAALSICGISWNARRRGSDRWCGSGPAATDTVGYRSIEHANGGVVIDAAARALGRRGGLAGRGASQRRGGKTPEEVSDHMRALGARGGAAGRGAKKARKPRAVH